ncbi:MAG: hypothetical protein H6737_27600 [Alphaproteobacteria bacterium]|nr:hypothetical protein [Alphaproteobacteria bacterium]
MRLKSFFAKGSALLALALVPMTASAITCDEITNMVRVNVPSNIVVSTIQSSGTRFTPADIQCLQAAGMPADVVGAAQAQAAAAAPVPQPMPAPLPNPTMLPPLPTPQPVPMPGLGDEQLGSDIPGEGAADADGCGSKVLEQLIAAQRAKKNLTASKGLFDLLQQRKFPQCETKIQYYLAKSLYELEMYHGAQFYFMEVVRRGPQNAYFKYALPRLVAIAELTGNDTELLRIVHKIPPEAFPRNAQDHLYYLLGRKHFEAGNLSAAVDQFKRVSAKSELYMRAKYYEGVVLNEQKKLRSAVAAFREVYQAKVQLTNTDPRYVQEVEDLKDLAIMNIARVYFGLQRFENAENYYALVDRESSYWPDSLFERAWSNFHMYDLNETLGLLLTANSPYFTNHEYNPELTVLRALTFWSLCDFDEVERILIKFEGDTKPQAAELKNFLNQYKSEQGQELADKAFDAYFIDGSAQSTLPKSMFHRVLRNRDLSSLIRHMDMMEDEIALIDHQKAIWKDTVGDHIKKVMAADRERYKKRAGLVMLAEMAKQQKALDDLLLQSEIIRFEVVDAQRKDYEFRAGNPDVDQVDERTIDFATSKDIIYWPFNGEFWKDELGYYRYTEEPQCN